jgi:hypothetical protein
MYLRVYKAEWQNDWGIMSWKGHGKKQAVVTMHYQKFKWTH